MSSIAIYSSTPDLKLTGIDDQSIRPVPQEPEATPQHLALFYTFAEKGDAGSHVLSGGNARALYGDKFLEYTSKYVTHSTVFMNGLFQEGNQIMLQRLIPRDAKKAWIRFSLCVTPGEMTSLVTETQTDPSAPGGKRTVTVQKPNGIQGHYLRWTTTVTDPASVNREKLNAENMALVMGSLSFGKGLEVGSLGRIGAEATVASAGISAISNEQERVYPIMDLEVSSEGEYGNNLGLRLSAPHEKSRNPMDKRFYNATYIRPYRVEMVKRKDRRSPATVVANNFGETATDFVFRPDTIDPIYNRDLYVGTSLLDNYRNLDTSRGRTPKYGPFNDIVVYSENIEHILRTLYEAEKVADLRQPETVEVVVPEYDPFTGAKVRDHRTTRPNPDRFRLSYLTADEKETKNEDELFWQIDFFTGLNHKGLAYRSIAVIDTLNQAVGPGGVTKEYLGPRVKRITMDATTEHWATGGKDGDVSIANYHRMVEEKLLAFDDSTNPFLDMARYPVSVFYDTGYPMEVKMAMCKLIKARKDISICLATHEVDETTFSPLRGVTPLDRGRETAAVSALSTIVRGFAESDFYGTSCVRANILMQAGKVVGSPYKGYVPATYELAMKRARFMGAGNGVMRPGFGYDQETFNIIQYMNNLTNPFNPMEVREANWMNGATYAQSYDRNDYFFAAVRTVYKEETSVLLSDINMLIATDLEKVCFRVWRRLVGNAKLTKAQFIERSNQLIEQLTEGRYDSRVRIVAETFYTPADEARGYSWNAKIHMYGNNMKTVGVMTVVTHRQEELEG